MGHPKLRQHLRKNGPRQKNVCQETVPGLEERVRPRRKRVSEGREIDGAAVIDGGGKKVDHHRPLTRQRSKHVHVERPLGAGELMRTGERVRENIADHWNELGSQPNLKRFRPTEDPLRNGVESRRPGASLLAQIGDRGEVVAKHRHRGPGQKGLEVEETVTYRQELPGIDGKKSLRLVPKA